MDTQIFERDIVKSILDPYYLLRHLPSGKSATLVESAIHTRHERSCSRIVALQNTTKYYLTPSCLNARNVNTHVNGKLHHTWREVKHGDYGNHSITVSSRLDQNHLFLN